MKITIESLTEGYIIENEGHEYAFHTMNEVAKKIQELFIPKKRKMPRVSKKVEIGYGERDLLISKFPYDSKLEKKYETISIFEESNGKVALTYNRYKIYTTKEKIMRLPFPVPKGIVSESPWQVRTAIRKYRKYIEEQKKIQIQIPGDDKNFKPMMSGIIQTIPEKED